ncbi:MAG: hypothetical protein K2K31_01160, partial [Clostridia bacterium]|nr:hypothetical protein [Clostridia bacterium]
MERQIKKVGNFVPRFFKTFSLYLIMTLMVFFGYVQIFGKMETGPITLPILGASAEEDNYFADFVQSFANFKNIDASFDLTVKNGNIDFSAKNSRVAFDMENQEFAFETLLNYNSQKFAVSAVYVDSCLHLSLNEKNYKFDTTNVPDMDMSGVLDFAMNTINIDTDAMLSKVSAIIGMDLTKIDSTTLLSSLETKEEILDDGTYKFNIKFGKLEALLYCDKDFNITSAKAQHSTLGGISLIADVSEMNSEDFAIEFEEPENEIELDGVMEYASYAKELNKKDIVSADLSLNVAGETYGGILTVDKTCGLKVKFEFNQGVNASIVYADNFVYAQIENVKVKFNVNDFNKFKDTIDKTIQNVTSATTKELIVSIIEKLFENENSDTSDFNVEDLVDDVTSKLDANQIITYLPDEAVMSGNQYSMIWNNGLSAVLTQKSGILDGVKIAYKDFELSADIHDGNAVEFDEQGYYDVVNLLPVAEVVNAIAQTRQFGGIVKLNVSGFDIEAEYYFDFSNEIKGVISFELFKEKFE